MLPVSLDCPFVIAPSVFSNVYLMLFVFVLCFVCPVLPVSLDCPFLIEPSVLCNVYLVVVVDSTLQWKHLQPYPSFPLAT